MLTLINTNRMMPPIAPLGLDYIAAAVRRAGHGVDVLDLCLAPDPQRAIVEYFAGNCPELVGLSFRNVDDCFWPSGSWFVPELQELVAEIRRRSEAKIVLGGVGVSIFARDIVEHTAADFGIHGDGEQSLVGLIGAVRDGRGYDGVPGLVWRDADGLRVNRPAWPKTVCLATERDAVDNATYFRRGGQLGVETRRGCPRECLYCADPLAKGRMSRLRDPAEVADEFAGLADRGLDVIHLCDAEFNLPVEHADAVCRALIARRMGERVRWYAYLAVRPFPPDLARLMRQAGCVGINFTSDSAHPQMLAAYRQPHCPEDLRDAVACCRREGIAVMLDLLLGGPGETEETVAESIRFMKEIGPDGVGASLGMRLYPGTGVIDALGGEEALDRIDGICRHYDGPVNLLRPTFFVSPHLGPRPARLIRELIGNDPRFFPPAEENENAGEPASDHNYNDNRRLTDAIAAGARGAYWDILRQLPRDQA